jgi:hypothetical protein
MDTYKVKSVVTDTARTFSEALLEAGTNPRIDRTDVKDIFKNVLAKIEYLQLQGFKVDFFVELHMIFRCLHSPGALQRSRQHGRDGGLRQTAGSPGDS